MWASNERLMVGKRTLSDHG